MKVEKEVILTGGGAKNVGLAKAISAYLGEDIQVPEEPLLIGALGAALFGRDVCLKAAKSGGKLETKERVLGTVAID